MKAFKNNIRISEQVVSPFKSYQHPKEPEGDGLEKETSRILNVIVSINLLATDFFFQILAHPVFKM